MREKDILFEKGRFFVVKASGYDGFEVFENGTTHSTRVARIGFAGEEGIERAKKEIDRRLEITKP